MFLFVLFCAVLFVCLNNIPGSHLISAFQKCHLIQSHKLVTNSDRHESCPAEDESLSDWGLRGVTPWTVGSCYEFIANTLVDDEKSCTYIDQPESTNWQILHGDILFSIYYMPIARAMLA